MKKILLSLFGIITLGLINFSSAGSYTYTGSFYFNTKVSGGNEFLVNPVPLVSSYVNSNITVSCTLFNFSSNLNGKQFTFRFYSPLYNYFDIQSSNGMQTETINVGNTYNFVGTLSNVSAYGFVCASSVNVGSSFDYSCTVSGDNIINQADLGGGSSNCIQCESDLSTCQSSLGSANLDLSTCQSSLSSANSDLSICQLTLSGYVNTLDNLSNNLQTCNSSLNACLQANCPDVEVPEVQWSAFWVNNTQVQGASNIYLYLPDFLNWDYTYIDSGSTLEIDVENEGDQEYINNILDIQSYHPDKDQFAMSFAGFLTLLMPYIIITLFIIFVWKLIRRIFR